MFGLYWFLLRQEKLFIFNRFFLIFSLLFSLIAPLITFHINFQTTINPEEIFTALDNKVTSINSSLGPINPHVNYTFTSSHSPKITITVSSILIILYITGFLFFLLRFFRNLFFIVKHIKSSTKINNVHCKLILIDLPVNPYCFLNSIFVNRQDYQNNLIDTRLFNHEMQHVKQSHSIDIFLIELIQIVYWFNPILIFYNKAIRTNHEYLADNGVIQNSFDAKGYVNILLNYIALKKNIPFTSGFNHSLTKKRLIMIVKPAANLLNKSVRIGVVLSLVLIFFIALSCNTAKTIPTNMFLIPQLELISKKSVGSDSLQNLNISLGAFYMSNEITNKEYREFTDWAKNNPGEQILGMVKDIPTKVKDPKTGEMRYVIFHLPDFTRMSDLLPKLIDSTALYKINKQYKNYFTDKKYDSYPVVGVSRNAAVYFCKWKTQFEIITKKEGKGIVTTIGPQTEFRLPLEVEWEYIANQPYKRKTPDDHLIRKVNDGNTNEWDVSHLDDNVSEWVLSSQDTLGVVRGGSWKTNSNLADRQVIDPNTEVGYIGFRIVRTFTSTQINKKQEN
jgi:beta-lactamase regulating signal transducer with metallopeptidase domain